MDVKSKSSKNNSVKSFMGKILNSNLFAPVNFTGGSAMTNLTFNHEETHTDMNSENPDDTEKSKTNAITEISQTMNQINSSNIVVCQPNRNFPSIDKGKSSISSKGKSNEKPENFENFSIYNIGQTDLSKKDQKNSNIAFIFPKDKTLKDDKNSCDLKSIGKKNSSNFFRSSKLGSNEITDSITEQNTNSVDKDKSQINNEINSNNLINNNLNVKNVNCFNNIGFKKR